MNPIGKALACCIMLTNLMSIFAESAAVEDETIALSGVHGGLVVILNNEKITSEIISRS